MTLEEGKTALDNRAALVTGGSQGIGLAIARRLGQAGCDLFLTDIADGEEGREIAKCLSNELSCKVRYHSADLTILDEVSELIVADRACVTLHSRDVV